MLEALDIDKLTVGVLVTCDRCPSSETGVDIHVIHASLQACQCIGYSVEVYMYVDCVLLHLLWIDGNTLPLQVSMGYLKNGPYTFTVSGLNGRVF